MIDIRVDTVCLWQSSLAENVYSQKQLSFGGGGQLPENGAPTNLSEAHTPRQQVLTPQLFIIIIVLAFLNTPRLCLLCVSINKVIIPDTIVYVYTSIVKEIREFAFSVCQETVIWWVFDNVLDNLRDNSA